MEQQKVSTGFQQQLTVLSLLLKGEHDAAAEYLRHGTVTTQGFMRFIERHNLQPLLFSLLDGSPVRKCLPHECVDTRFKAVPLKAVPLKDYKALMEGGARSSME